MFAARPTGVAYDGDTFRLDDGRNARLFGVDAFERYQTGRSPSGAIVPLGQLARDALLPFTAPGSTISPTGAVTYGRPVATLTGPQGDDAGTDLLNKGLALTYPQYLRADPKRFVDYTTDERVARLNRRGTFAGKFQTPEDFRRGKPDPWDKPEPLKDGDINGTGVWWDQPLPEAGLKPEIEKAYSDLWMRPDVTPEQLIAFARDNGFQIDPAEVTKAFEGRKTRPLGSTVTYKERPRVLTDGGGRGTGAAIRGFADPINALDELGAFADTLGATPGRENVWNSDRRIADVFNNNLGQNRSILDYDQANYPWQRFGGQLATSFVVPGVSIEGAGTRAAAETLAGGGSEFLASAAAKRAVTRGLIGTGAGEGALSGFAGSDGSLLDRVQGGVVGGVLGTGLGVALGKGAPIALSYAKRARGMFGGSVAGKPGRFVPSVLNPSLLKRTRIGAEPELGPSGIDPATTALDDVPRPGAADDPSTADLRTIGMDNETPAPSITADLPGALRPVDRIDVSRPRPLLAPAPDAERIAAADGLDPTGVLPIPANTVGSMDEAERIGAGMYQPVKALDELSILATRNIPSPNNPTKSMPKRGPLDLVTWLRTQGGLKPEGGELNWSGIDNAPRKGLDFAGGEGRFGKLVNPGDGLNYEDAARLAWDAGYFPGSEPPTTREFLEALADTHAGRNRAFSLDDQEEIGRFNDARDQRWAAEKADSEGAPLVHDNSEPAGPDALDANAAPPNAYEDAGENAPNAAGNIRLDKLDSPQAIKRALSTVHARVGGFDAATRGRITMEETGRLASELNMTPETLLARRKGQALNAEEATAARRILAKSGNELVNLARRIKGGNATEADMAGWRTAVVRHAAIQEQVSGAVAEAGRTLSSLRAVADSRAVKGEVLKSLIHSAGGPDDIKAAADMIIDAADDPARLNTIATALTRPKLKDKALEIYVNFLLSGPRTHAVNITSNLLTGLSQFPEHALAAGIGLARKATPMTAGADRVLFSETGARAVGMMQGAMEGLRQFGRTLRTGMPSDLTSKVEAQSYEAIGGLAGEVVRLPTRLLSAEDELFKGMARRQEVVGLATRQAGEEGLTGAAARKRAAELAANPTPDMLERAGDYARYITFQRPLGPSGQALSTFVEKTPALKLFIPFLRTPTNILKFAAERSPLAPILREWRADIAAGGARADLAAARMTAGTGMMLLAVEAARRGMITGGGPADDGRKRLMLADGWQPYSVKIGDNYVSYGRLDPFATTIGLAADYVDLQDGMSEADQGDLATKMFQSTLQNLSSKTWLSGMNSLAEAMNDPGRYGQGFVARLVGSSVPAFFAQTAQAVDPTERDARGAIDRIRSRIPGASFDLPVRRDVLGQPVEDGYGAGLAAFSPVPITTSRRDPVIEGLLGARVKIGMPQRGEMSPQEFSDLQGRVGTAARPQLEALVLGQGWSLLSAEDRQDAVDAVVRTARKIAKGGSSSPIERRRQSEVPPGVPPPPPGFTLMPSDPPPPPGFRPVQ